jgi:hypothetical protein
MAGKINWDLANRVDKARRDEIPGLIPQRPAGAKINAAEQRFQRGNFKLPSPQEVIAARSAKGGWTALQLAEWGIPWPAPLGWQDALRREWEKSRRTKRG